MHRLRSMLRSVKNHPRAGVLLSVLLVVLVVGLLFPRVTHAGVLGDAIVEVLGWILSIVVSILGKLLVKFIDVLIWVFQFNNFVGSKAVTIGWSVTRDVANMVFIIVLLVIAIGTVFRIQEYKASRLLQKVILMAILINFSKLIAGFFIDLSQVVMLTFVNAFKDMAAGNLTTGFGLNKIVAISQTASAAGGDVNYWSIVGAMFAAVVMLFVALIVVGIFVVLLIQRIVMLWIYIVLAPTAYMVYALPPGFNSWWSSWWRDFSQYLIKGPVIAFFMWLALTIISLDNTIIFKDSTEPADTTNQTGTTQQTDLSAFASEATTSQAIISYILAIGMLIAGLQQAAKSGGAAGNLAGKWMGNLNRAGNWAVSRPKVIAGGVAGYAGGRLANATAPTGYSLASGTLGALGRLPGGAGRYFTRQQSKVDDARYKAIGKESPEVKSMSDAQLDQLMKRQSIPLGQEGQRFYNNVLKENVRRKRFDKMSDSQMQHFMQMNGITVTGNDEGRLKFDARNRAVFEDFKNNFKSHPEILEKVGRANGLEENAQRQMLHNLRGLTPGEWGQISNDAIAEGNPATQNALRQAYTDLGENAQENVMNRLRTRVEMRDFLGGGGGRENDDDVAVEEEEDGLQAHEDIDRKRQARTAERIAAYRKRNENFFESNEYAANTGQFYDATSYASNAKQLARRTERQDLKAGGASLPLTGASTFAAKQSNTLAVDNEVLQAAGIKATAGGNVSNDDKEKLATALLGKVTQDIADVEQQIANTAPDVLDSIQEGSETTVRAGLAARKRNLEGVKARLQDPEDLKQISFINADRYGGQARTIIAEEEFHQQLNAMDADGSFRKNLLESLSPEDRQAITAQVRQKTGRSNLNENQAFDEYLAKGLTNLTRGSWADTSPDAIALKSGLALAIQRQAEARGVKLRKLSLLQDFDVPQKAGPGRYIADRVKEAFTPAPAKTLESKVLAERQQKTLAEQARQQKENAQAYAVATKQAHADAQQKLADLQRTNAGKAADMRKRYDELQATYADRTKSREERDNAYHVMGAYANSIEDLKKETATQEAVVANAKAEADRAQAALQKLQPKKREVPPPPIAPSGKATRQSTPPATNRGARVAPDAVQSAPSVTGQPSTQNITQNIQNVFKSAPEAVKSTFAKMDNTYLDSALRSSIVWKGLMRVIRDNLAEVQKSSKLSALGRTDLTKRLNSLQKHVDTDTAESRDAFKQELGELQGFFGSSSGEGTE